MIDFINEIVNEILEENTIKNIVVIYGGRFQPFHSGHFDSYSKLKSKFKGADVYIATSDKVELPKSPFNFKEKKLIIQRMFGVNPNFIQNVKNPYSPKEILQKYDPETTALIIFVSSKDANRFTGGKYFKPWEGKAEVGFLDGGYVYIDDPGGGGLSGTEVRNILKTGTDDEKLKVFKKLYPKFDKKIYDLIVGKLNESENLFVSKEIIENWLKNKSNKKLIEISIATWPAFGKPIDDGPGLFLKDIDVYKGVNAERAAKLGWHVISHLVNDTMEDYNELRDPGYITNFEIGVPWRRDAEDREKMKDGTSYDDWVNSVLNKSTLVGYSILKDKYAIENDKLQKKLIKKDVLDATDVKSAQYLNPKNESFYGGDIAAGSPETSYTTDGNLRLLDRGKPEPWFKQLGYTQMDKPRASFMRGRLKKDRTPELLTRKATFTVTNYKSSTLKPALKPVGVDEWVPVEPVETKETKKMKKPKTKKMTEDLRKWLGSGPTGGWDRYSTTGEKLGKCGDAKEGEPYSVCLSNEKARKLGKDGIASFVRRKRAAQKKAGDAKKGGEQTKGQKPVFVKTGLEERLNEVMSLFLEKNEPTDAAKWSYAKSQAKQKFDVYPSAYANAWAAKKYKELGGKWRKTESILSEIPKDDLAKIDQYADKQLSPINVVITDKHFFDRLNDPRNDKPITSAELIGFFKRLSKNKKKFIEFLKQYNQIVAKDNRTNINIPFMLSANSAIAKTVMRKNDFKTSNPKYQFEDTDLTNLFGDKPNKVEPAEKILFDSLIKFMQKSLGFSAKIIIKRSRPSSKSGASAWILIGPKPPKTFIIQYNPNKSYSNILQQIIHELTHVKQVVKNELKSTDDVKSVIWDGKVFISAKDLINMMKKDFNQYKNLPWEKEAYGNQKKYYDMFLKSQEFKNLVDKDSNLNNIISNLNENIEDKIEKQFDIIADIYERNDYIVLSRMEIPKEKRGTGIGTKAMNVLINYADSVGKDIFLTPSTDFGASSKSRLEKFYRGFGFVPNKGKNKDFRSRETMVRKATKNEISELLMGYPDQKWMDKHDKEIKRLRKKFNSQIDGDSHYKPIKENILLEGGAYGHLSHPFETDLNLSFKDLKNIVNKALEGNLEFTREKTDGMNITVSWKNGKLVAARSKSQLKNKGETAMDITQVATKFEGRGGIADAFNFAMQDLTKAISALSETQKEQIFGEGSKFMSLEIIYPEASNVIVYGQPLLVFHGTLEYDEDGNPIGEDPESGRVLEKMLKSVNQTVQDKFSIQSQPALKLPQNQTLNNLKPKYLSMLSKLQTEFGLNDSNSVVDYHKAWWSSYIKKNAPTTVSADVLNGLTNRWALEDKSFRLDKKNISDEKLLAWAVGIDKKDFTKFKKENFMKFEDIFLGIGADILSFLSSALVVNPDAAIKNVKAKLDTAINDIKKSGDPNKLNKLEIELKRLESIGGTDTIIPVEGIVFVYKGVPMKLTGKFAPINQILNTMY
jgi:predicted GNAT family N-acyltransferase